MANKSVFKFGNNPAATGVEEDVENLDIEDEEGEGEDLPNSILNRVIALKESHEAMLEIDAEYKKERAALEKKYNALKNVVWDKRTGIVTGETDVEAKVPVEADDVTKGVPGFWATAICNHPVVGGLVTEEDMDCLTSLTNVRCEYNDEWTGFTLYFTFAENKYFTNKELKKTYVVSPDLMEDKSPELNSVEGTAIDWQPKLNLTVTEVSKKQKSKSGRNAGQTRTITKQVPKASFFHYFADPKMPDEDEDEDEEDEKKDEGNDLQLTIDEDYEAGHAFRTEIVPDAVLWFTGEADSGEFDDEGDEEEDDHEDHEDDDESGDEKGAGALVQTPGGGFAGAPAAPGAPAADAPECKQS